MSLERLLLRAVVRLNVKAKGLAIRLTRWTGKSAEAIHPKHLLGETAAHRWYLDALAPSMTVLDVGCGPGGHALKLAARCQNLVGLDRDVAALGAATRSARRAGLRHLHVVAADLESPLPVASGSIDAVVCLDVLEHLHQRDQLLAELRRVLRPGGVLCLSVPNRATAWKQRLAHAGLFAYSDPDHKVEYTLDGLREDLSRACFRLVRLHPSVIDLPLIGLLDVVGGCWLGAYRWLTNARRWLAMRWPEQNAGFYAVCSAQEAP